jgi:L-lactate permease
MNQELLKRIMIRNALFWVIAIMLPVVVMILLDLFEAHTPSRVAIVAGMSLIVPFILSHLYLGRELGRLISPAKDQV